MSSSSQSSTAVASSASAARYPRTTDFFHDRDHDLASINSSSGGGPTSSNDGSASSIVSGSSSIDNHHNSTNPRRGELSDAGDHESSRRKHDEARAAIMATLDSAGSAYDAAYQRRAVDLHGNAAALGRQQRDVERAAAALGRESGKWQKEVDRMTRGLNEFGDLQNWAEMMEHDMLVLEETLRLVDGQAEIESASGGSPWRETNAHTADLI